MRNSYISYLLEQVKKSKFFREEVTVSEVSRFKEWIKKIDDSSLIKIFREQATEELIKRLVQAKGSDAPGLAANSRSVTPITNDAIQQVESNCNKECKEDHECFFRLAISRLQYMIGSLKVEKDKCDSTKDPKICFDRFDEAIRNISIKVESMVKSYKAKYGHLSKEKR
jgi:hypothetical protein